MNFDQYLRYAIEHGHTPPGVEPPQPSFFIPSAVGAPQPVAGIAVPDLPLERRVAELADLSDV